MNGGFEKTQTKQCGVLYHQKRVGDLSLRDGLR
ncbi:hypothetical protein SAMN05444000_1631 [Shimia gijangensis]|uniref:Uncharacterized protein n=1 Tax=Shimia gijangensis TaxID=1470563 RepID=A0A1M6UCG4_9RHOB|nr:hypothetical protein SAMN05444000_1631 [Shimia gijangensis]